MCYRIDVFFFDVYSSVKTKLVHSLNALVCLFIGYVKHIMQFTFYFFVYFCLFCFIVVIKDFLAFTQ